LRTQSFIRFARKAWVGKAIDQWLLNNQINVHETMELDTLEATAAMEEAVTDSGKLWANQSITKIE